MIIFSRSNSCTISLQNIFRPLMSNRLLGLFYLNLMWPKMTGDVLNDLLKFCFQTYCLFPSRNKMSPISLTLLSHSHHHYTIQRTPINDVSALGEGVKYFVTTCFVLEKRDKEGGVCSKFI